MYQFFRHAIFIDTNSAIIGYLYIHKLSLDSKSNYDNMMALAQSVIHTISKLIFVD